MLLKDQKELKSAITALPDKEKDKLLLRLIAKDKVLTEHLHFKLLEDTADLEYRKDQLAAEINESFSLLKSMKRPTDKDVLAMLRRLNGLVNHHFKVTKDVQTEVELRLLMLRQAETPPAENIFSPFAKYNERLRTYFLRTVIAVYKKYSKLHDDLQYDLKEEFNLVLHNIQQYQLGRAAREAGLPEELY